MASQQYKTVDLFKFIAALSILLLHVPPFRAGTFAYVVIREIITVFAVPFFFAASGFFAVSQLQALTCSFKSRSMWHVIFRPYKMYLVWTLFYFPIVVFGWFFSSKSLAQNVLLWVRDFFLEGSYLTIWFLNALTFAFLLYALLLRFFSPQTCFLISMPLFLLACLLSTYNGLLMHTATGRWLSTEYYSFFSSTKNGLFFGLPFVALGGCIRMAPPYKKPSYATIGVVASFALLVSEVLIRRHFFEDVKSVDFALSLLPLTFFLLRLATSFEVKECLLSKRDQSIYPLLRKLSTLIFLTQRFFIFGFEMLDKFIKFKIGRYFISVIPSLHFFLVTITTIGFSCFLYYVSQKYRWLRKIY